MIMSMTKENKWQQSSGKSGQHHNDNNLQYVSCIGHGELALVSLANIKTMIDSRIETNSI